MARRSRDVGGYVDFPMNDPRYRCTGEGGLSVILVVAEKEGERWHQCSAQDAFLSMNECLIWDDVHQKGEYDPEKHRYTHPVEEFHFPRLEEGTQTWGTQGERDFMRYVSTPYLAVISLGSTGWSGCTEHEGYFRCTYENLTEKGKALYDQIKDLYGDGATLYLQTWLDT